MKNHEEHILVSTPWKRSVIATGDTGRSVWLPNSDDDNTFSRIRQEPFGERLRRQLAAEVA